MSAVFRFTEIAGASYMLMGRLSLHFAARTAERLVPPGAGRCAGLPGGGHGEQQQGSSAGADSAGASGSTARGRAEGQVVG